MSKMFNAKFQRKIQKSKNQLYEQQKHNRYQKSMDTTNGNKTRHTFQARRQQLGRITQQMRERNQLERNPHTHRHTEKDGIFVFFNFDQFPNYATGNSKVRRFQRKQKKVHEKITKKNVKKSSGYEFNESQRKSYSEYKTKQKDKRTI